MACSCFVMPLVQLVAGMRGRAADNAAAAIKVPVQPHAAKAEEVPGAMVQPAVMRSSSGYTREGGGGSGSRCCVGLG